jgi:hypothetical protein
MSFETVKTARGQTPDPTPKLAIYPRGEGRFNAAATGHWFGDADRVQAWTNRDTGQLAFSVVADGDAGLSLTPKHGGQTLSLRSVLRVLDAPHTQLNQTVYLDLRFASEEGLVVADCTPLFEEVSDRE